MIANLRASFNKIKNHSDNSTGKLFKIRCNERSEQILQNVDRILAEEVKRRPSITIEDLQRLIYCGALTVIHADHETYPEPPDEFPHGDRELQHQLFQQSPKRFYRLLLADPPDKSSTIKGEEVAAFWSSIWGIPTIPSAESESFLHLEQHRLSNIPDMETAEITMEVMRRSLRKMKNWGTPGPDGIHIFWYKKFKSLHPLLLTFINGWIREPSTIPKFLTRGFTKLMVKNQQGDQPGGYRPMTFLPALYKIMSKCISQCIFRHYQRNGILAPEQMGDRPGCHGCKKVNWVDAIVAKQPSYWGVCFDYTKAMDLVSHQWLLSVLRLYKVNETLIQFIDNAMKSWRTCLYLNGQLCSGEILLRRGIFQGDPIAALFYWTIMTPLSFHLNAQKVGLPMKNGGIISHLIYMDDFKIYARNFNDLQIMYDLFSSYSEAIGMRVNLEKSYAFRVKNGKICNCKRKLGTVEFTAESRSFLGQNQLDPHRAVRQKISSFRDKVDKVIDTQLQLSDKINLVNYLINLYLSKSFGILLWNRLYVDLLIDKMLVVLGERYMNKKAVKNSATLAVCNKIVYNILRLSKSFANDDSDLVKSALRNDVELTPIGLKILFTEFYLKYVKLQYVA